MSNECKILNFPSKERKQDQNGQPANDERATADDELLRRRSEKRINAVEFINGLLNAGLVRIFVDPQKEAVVPKKFKNDKVLILDFSRRFLSEIILNNEGIRQRLSFDGVEHDCFVPFKAFMAVLCDAKNVFAIFDERMHQLINQVHDKK